MGRCHSGIPFAALASVAGRHSVPPAAACPLRPPVDGDLGLSAPPWRLPRGWLSVSTLRTCRTRAAAGRAEQPADLCEHLQTTQAPLHVLYKDQRLSPSDTPDSCGHSWFPQGHLGPEGGGAHTPSGAWLGSQGQSGPVWSLRLHVSPRPRTRNSVSRTGGQRLGYLRVPVTRSPPFRMPFVSTFPAKMHTFFTALLMELTCGFLRPNSLSISTGEWWKQHFSDESGP